MGIPLLSGQVQNPLKNREREGGRERGNWRKVGRPRISPRGLARPGRQPEPFSGNSTPLSCSFRYKRQNASWETSELASNDAAAAQTRFPGAPSGPDCDFWLHSEASAFRGWLQRDLVWGLLFQHLRSLFIYFIPGKVTEPAGRSGNYRSDQRFSGSRSLPGQGFQVLRANVWGPIFGNESSSPAAAWLHPVHLTPLTCLPCSMVLGPATLVPLKIISTVLWESVSCI